MKNLRTSCCGWLIATGIALVVGPAAAGPSRSYISEDGPPALRFAAKKKLQVKKELPPLEMESKDAGPQSPPEEHAQVTEIPEETSSTASEPIVIPPAAIPQTPALPGTSISPQMLLSYFGAPGTNGVNPVVMTPVSFVPPTSSSGGSSRATYKTVP